VGLSLLSSSRLALSVLYKADSDLRPVCINQMNRMNSVRLLVALSDDHRTITRINNHEHCHWYYLARRAGARPAVTRRAVYSPAISSSLKIVAVENISECTLPIITKFSGSVDVWAAIINQTLVCDRSMTLVS